MTMAYKDLSDYLHGVLLFKSMDWRVLGNLKIFQSYGTLPIERLKEIFFTEGDPVSKQELIALTNCCRGFTELPVRLETLEMLATERVVAAHGKQDIAS